jgi:phenylacetate-coenzyme A ligase PaaK-like adenylate-forming protein
VPAPPRLSVTTPLDEIVAALNAFRPQAVVTMAGVAALLAEEQLAERLLIQPELVICTSEELSPDMRERISAAWTVAPHEMYSTTEAGVLASSSPVQAGMHLWEDMVLLEVVDAANQPVPPGTAGAKVLVTNLVNRTQPLIRYELADVVTVAETPDPHGWPFRRVTEVHGRSDDVLWLSRPDGGTVAVHAAHLSAAFTGLLDVVQYQIVQEPSGLVARVVLRPGTPAGITEQIRLALLQKVTAAHVAPLPIRVEVVSRIAPDNDQIGKFRIVKAATLPSGVDGS